MPTCSPPPASLRCFFSADGTARLKAWDFRRFLCRRFSPPLFPYFGFPSYSFSLFVFVIMLLNAGEEEHTQGSRFVLIFGIPAIAALVGMIVYVLVNRSQMNAGIELGSFMGSTAGVANLLFKEFLLPFEVTSVLIL